MKVRIFFNAKVEYFFLSDTAHIGYKVISDDRRISVSNGMLLRQCNLIFFEKVSKCSNSKSNAIKTYPKIFRRLRDSCLRDACRLRAACQHCNGLPKKRRSVG